MTVIKLTTVPDRKHFIATMMMLYCYQVNSAVHTQHSRYNLDWIQFKLEESMGDKWKPDLAIGMGNRRHSSTVVWEVQKELDKAYVSNFNERLSGFRGKYGDNTDMVGDILPLKKMPNDIDDAFDWVDERAIIWPKWVKVK